jgi:hypothetical protein
VSRPKAPVQGQPWQRALAGQAEPTLLDLEQMQEFVDTDRVKVREQSDVWGFALAQNVFALDYWLAKGARRRSVQRREDNRRTAQS